MDSIKNIVGKAQKSSSSGTGTSNSSSNAAQGGGNAQKDDYADKAFSMGSKKAGYNIDRNTQEKITDGARGMYEKSTGNKVDPKWSN